MVYGLMIKAMNKCPCLWISWIANTQRTYDKDHGQ